MKPSVVKGLIFAGIVILAFIIGDFIMKAAFFGCVMLAGLVVMLSSMPKLQKVMARMTGVLDVAIFLFTIIATAQFGLNITAALTIAGLGYTLVYAPWLREKYATEAKKNKKPPIRSSRSHFDCR